MGHRSVFLTGDLASLALGSLVLSPTFAPNTYANSTNSTNVSDTLSYTTADTGATVTTKLNGTTFTGSTVTWTGSTDTLTIEVDAGMGVTKTYTITCTHTP